MRSHAHQLSIPLGKCERTGCSHAAEINRCIPLNLGGVLVLAEVHLCPACDFYRQTMSELPTAHIA